MNQKSFQNIFNLRAHVRDHENIMKVFFEVEKINLKVKQRDIVTREYNE